MNVAPIYYVMLPLTTGKSKAHVTQGFQISAARAGGKLLRLRPARYYNRSVCGKETFENRICSRTNQPDFHVYKYHIWDSLSLQVPLCVHNGQSYLQVVKYLFCSPKSYEKSHNKSKSGIRKKIPLISRVVHMNPAQTNVCVREKKIYYKVQ